MNRAQAVVHARFFNLIPDFQVSTSHHISSQGSSTAGAMRQNYLLVGAAGTRSFPQSLPAF